MSADDHDAINPGIVLDPAAWAALVDLCENPPPPTETLIRCMAPDAAKAILDTLSPAEFMTATAGRCVTCGHRDEQCECKPERG